MRPVSICAALLFVTLTEAAHSQDFVLQDYSDAGGSSSYTLGYFLPADHVDQILLYHETGGRAFAYTTLSCHDRTNECFGENVTISRSGRRQQHRLRLWFTPSLDAPDYVVLAQRLVESNGVEKRRADRILEVLYWERGANGLRLNPPQISASKNWARSAD